MATTARRMSSPPVQTTGKRNIADPFYFTHVVCAHAQRGLLRVGRQARESRARPALQPDSRAWSIESGKEKSGGRMHDPEKIKENIAAAAVSGAGATVGSAGGATVGVLELAARGAVTGLSASVVIGAGAVAGAGLAYGLFRLIRGRRKGRTLNEPAIASPRSDTRR